MVTFCLKRSLTIASLALSFMYESLWNFLSILPLWWSIFFITWYVTSEVIEGHKRSWKMSISITLLALSLMYESFWNILRIFILWWRIFFILWHVTSEVIEGHITSSKRSISIASLALSLIYESLWNFLSILTLSNDPRGHLGHIRSLLYFERSISVTSIFMYRFW